MQKEIKQTWFFDQSPQEVWDYFTKPELIEQWLGENDFQPVVGHKFQFTSPYGNHSYCEVLEVNPVTKLSYSWQKRSAKDKKPFHSTIEWTFIPKGDGTEVRLLHGGFTAIEDVVAHENGWNICSKQLAELLNTVKK